MKTCPEILKDVMPNIKEVNIDALRSALAKPTSLLIDVREPSEFEQGHVDGAVSIPRGLLEMKIHQHPTVQNIESPQAALQALSQYDLYVMCQAGGRSALAAESLQRMGFTNVYSVKGGWGEWKKAH